MRCSDWRKLSQIIGVGRRRCHDWGAATSVEVYSFFSGHFTDIRHRPVHIGGARVHNLGALTSWVRQFPSSPLPASPHPILWSGVRGVTPGTFLEFYTAVGEFKRIFGERIGLLSTVSSWKKQLIKLESVTARRSASFMQIRDHFLQFRNTGPENNKELLLVDHEAGTSVRVAWQSSSPLSVRYQQRSTITTQ